MADLAPHQSAIPDAEDEDLIIRPGQQPPFVIPWCASCKDTVESFNFDVATTGIRIGLKATCHGKTEGIWLYAEDLFARKHLGKPVVMFKRAAFNGVR